MYRTILSQTSPPIFFVRQRAVRTMGLGKDATISGVPVTFNFFSDKRFVRAALASQMNVLTQMGFKDMGHIPDEVLDAVQTQLSAQADSTYAAKLPITKNLKNGVYIMPLTKEFLKKNSLTKIIPLSRTILDDALTYLLESVEFSPKFLGLNLPFVGVYPHLLESIQFVYLLLGVDIWWYDLHEPVDDIAFDQVLWKCGALLVDSFDGQVDRQLLPVRPDDLSPRI